ncbi:MAG: glucosaminidase domain-containing protein [Hyphomicrobiaceae bacterium]
MIRNPCAAFSVFLIVGTGMTVAGTAAGASAPAIRLSANNQVPSCVTPARLDAFLNDQIARRGFKLDPSHHNIAKWYRRHGESQRVRWDFAFFQMALETNFLSFRRSNGQRGDVLPRQNNFAGLGTTGGGVRGDRYPDVSTGVLAQIQHLVVYSGQRLKRPTGHRTRLKQNIILNSVKKIARRRPVTFADLAGRWAADRRYGHSILRLANRFFRHYCNGDVIASSAPSASVARRTPARLIPVTVTRGRGASGPTARKVLQVARPSGTGQVTSSAYVARPTLQTTQRQSQIAAARPQAPAAFGRASTSPVNKLANMRTFTPRTTPARAPTIGRAAKSANAPLPDCRIQTAGYGGQRTVLIKSMSDTTTRLTALNVYPGFEEMMAQSFINSHAPTGKTIGMFDSREAAVAQAQALCQQPATKAAK